MSLAFLALCAATVSMLDWTDTPVAPGLSFDLATRSFPPIVVGIRCLF